VFHYAALAMQSESQLAAEYGLTMSGLASGASQDSSSSCHMKSEYAASYPAEFGAGTASYGYPHPHPHHHNAWAAAYHPHATA